MPRKYRHIKDYKKELIEYKTGTVPCLTLFYLKFNSSANSAVFVLSAQSGAVHRSLLAFFYNAVVKV